MIRITSQVNLVMSGCLSVRMDENISGTTKAEKQRLDTQILLNHPKAENSVQL